MVSSAHFAAAAVRAKSGWSAAELDLDGLADIDEVADRLRDVDPDASVSLLFVEADDTYLVILRLDEGEDLRVFGSDNHDQAVLVGRLDNLGKGASGAAVQNLGLMLGLD